MIKWLKWVICGNLPEDPEVEQAPPLTEAWDVMPKLSDAPKWAKWVAFDNGNRRWCWYKKRPSVKFEVKEFGVIWWWFTPGRFEHVGEPAERCLDEWRETLQKVPR